VSGFAQEVYYVNSISEVPSKPSLVSGAVIRLSPASPVRRRCSQLFQRDYKVAGSYPRRPQGPDNSAGHTKATDSGLQPPRPRKEPGVTGTMSYPQKAARAPDPVHGHQLNQLDKTLPSPPTSQRALTTNQRGGEGRPRDAIRTVHPKPARDREPSTRTPQRRQREKRPRKHHPE
jgi:hypothetical protein